MTAIEPNPPALVAFALLWGATCLAFLVLSGMYPERPQAARGTGGSALVALNTVLWVGLAAVTLLFGYEQLRLTSLIVVAGLVFLFAPVPFELVPERWRDGRAGLLLLVLIQAAALAAGLAASGRDGALVSGFLS